MKPTYLDRERLRSLYPETPQSFKDFVEKELRCITKAKEIPVMKKKLSLGLAVALVLALLLAAAAVAALLSPTADIFGFLYGKDMRDALLKGDIAAVGQTHIHGELAATLEEVVYRADGDMPGLYGTGIIAPAAGSSLVLVPEDYSVNDPAGHAVHYDRDLQIPADAPSYAELARRTGARMLVVRALADAVPIDGNTVDADMGYSLIPQEDGTVRFAFEAASNQTRRAEHYDLTLRLGFREIDSQGVSGEYQSDTWTVRAAPALSETARAAIARTPAAYPSQVPPPAAGAIRIVGSLWGGEEVYLAQNPARQVENIRVGYGGQYEYISNPDNPWDVAFMFLTQGDFDALVKAGRLLSLSEDPVIARRLSRMYPAVQAAVTREDRAYALPSGIFGYSFQFGAGHENTWARLGLSRDLMPETFGELCALAETYMSLPLQDRQGSSFLQNDSAAASRYILLDYLMRIRFGEALNETGPVTFDTPEFREALEQVERAANALRGKQAGPDSKGTRHALIWENSNNLTEENSLFLRLGKTPAYPVTVAVLMVNADGTNQEAALEYARWFSDNLSGRLLGLLDQEISAREAALYAIQHDLDLRRATGSEDGDIAALEERLQNGDFSDFGPTEESLARYRREIGPNLTVMTRELPEAAFKARDSYLNGAMHAEAFIRALQATLGDSSGK